MLIVFAQADDGGLMDDVTNPIGQLTLIWGTAALLVGLVLSCTRSVQFLRRTQYYALRQPFSGILALRDLAWFGVDSLRHGTKPSRAMVQRWAEFWLLKPQEARALRSWRRQWDGVVFLAKPYSFRTCFGLHAAFTQFDRIAKYVERLGYLESAGRLPKGFSSSFLCRVSVRDGFVTPLYLISGILTNFKNEWPPIVNQYGDAVLALEDAKSYVKLTKIQLYQFFCWLIWGPSVPICQGSDECTKWGDENSTHHIFQYGYGDENNSVLLEAPTGGMFGQSTKKAKGKQPPRAPLAVRASITAKVTFKSRILDRLPKGYKEAGGADLVLQLLTAEEAAAYEKPAPLPPDARDYYGAYIWVMFCVCKQVEGVGSPRYRGLFNEQEGEWRNLLPYFIHGNLAEMESYNHVCDMVAHAAIAGAERILDADSTNSLYLVYVSAIDDSNCGAHLLSVNLNSDDLAQLPKIESTERIVDRLRTLKRTKGKPLDRMILPSSGGSELPATRNDMAEFWSSPAKLFGCRLPEIVDDFMDITRKDDGALDRVADEFDRRASPTNSVVVRKAVDPPHSKPAVQSADEVAANRGSSSPHE